MKKNAAKAFEEESRFSPLVTAVISVFITAGVFIGADLLNKTVDYTTREPEEPVRVSARLREPAYSPDRAKRRAGYFLGRREGQPESDAELEADIEEEAEAEEESVKAEPGEETVKAEKPVSEAGGGTEDFGTYSQSAEGITLQGVMVGGDSGIAVLSLGGASHTLSEGQTLQGYKVDKVLSDRVVLRKGGRSVTLSLSSAASGTETLAGENAQGHPVLPNPKDVPPPAKPGANSSAASARRGTVHADKGAASVEPLASPVPFSETEDYNDGRESGGGMPEPARVEVKNFADSGKRFESYYQEDSGLTSADIKSGGPEVSPTPMHPSREELSGYLKRGAAIISEVRATPDEEDMGVKLKFLKSDNIFSRLGLQDGDTVTRINNKTVLSSEELFNSVLTVSEMPFVNIEYKRKGQDGSLVYDLQ
ncbi:hypothetical protein IJT93_12240 [bacterium]|nr:hypothetical protein [bacterium]